MTSALSEIAFADFSVYWMRRRNVTINIERQKGQAIDLLITSLQTSDFKDGTDLNQANEI